MKAVEFATESGDLPRRRMTATEEIFLQLRSDIIAMKLTPGTKISEAEVAKMRSVSRQPVREAFLRLGELNLLQIVPQKATRIRKISHSDLRNTRFLRAAVEVEVVRIACDVATDESLQEISENLDEQRLAVEAKDANALRSLDYEFHRLICVAADCLPAFEAIAENKAHTDRVCSLELADTSGMDEVFEGHSAMFEAIKLGDVHTAVEATRYHLSHLDETLAMASEKYPDFFEA
ncbi:GntR family transcriptional regulator [Shimia sp.]|uniref:GntR family transcriptional regulator n=1 Tax=Shimia sp. TaxID=1954381 RepID=UPI003297395C